MIGIIGAGESGTYAGLLAKKNGEEVLVSDHGEIETAYKLLLMKNKVPFEEKGHSFDKLVKSKWIIKSPGVPEKADIIRRLLKAGVPIMSEIEYAFGFVQGKVVAITGSNGKTTTTNLIHHLLVTSGFSAVKGGNLGRSLSNIIFHDEVAELYILEVSSFQLDDIISFRPDHAMILNITPDHLDRYGGNFDLYARSKWRICENLRKEDVFYYLDNDEVVLKLIEEVGCGARFVAIPGDGHLYSDRHVDNVFLKGLHNAQNASFAISLVRDLGCSPCDIDEGLRSFRNDDHRMQLIGRINGVDWINDSKATNVESSFSALSSVEAPIIWIAGGIDKGNDYSSLIPLVKERVKILLCLGKDNRKLVEAFSNSVSRIKETTTMEELIAWAMEESEEGDVVLLSPACASFDLFQNYKDRGNRFTEAVWSQMEE